MSNERVFVGDKNTEWYKRCREYLDESKIQFDKAEQVCNKYGISKESIAIDYDTLYLKYEVAYLPEIIKMFKSVPFCGKHGTFNIVKKNSPLGKEFKKLKISKPSSPMVGFKLFGGRMMSYGQFIHNEHVYVRVLCDQELDCPAGFTEMKLSEFWALAEKIQDKTNNLHLENI